MRGSSLLRRVSVLVLFVCNFLEEAKFTTAHRLYTIHSNLESVEKLAVDYANGQSGFVLNRPVHKEPTNKICRLALELKITLCWKFLTYEEYKFKFTFNMDAGTLRTECSGENFYLRSLDKSELRIPQVSMFRCPFIGEAPFLKKAVAFYFSDTHLLSSAAVIYIQESPHSAIYPYKYLDRISFDDLKASKDLLYLTNPPPQSGKNIANELYKENRPRLDLGEEKEKVVEMLVDKIKIREPYSKFEAFYDAIDLCGLSMTQKIVLCRETIVSHASDDRENNIDINEFAEDGCRNYEFRNVNDEKHELSGFQCPAAVEYQPVENRWGEKTYEPATYFLLKNISSSRLSILKLLKNGLEIESQLTNVHSRLLKAVKQTENTLELTKYVESDIYDPNPDYKGENPSYKRAFPIVINRRMAEENAMKFAIIKKIELQFGCNRPKSKLKYVLLATIIYYDKNRWGIPYSSHEADSKSWFLTTPSLFNIGQYESPIQNNVAYEKFVTTFKIRNVCALRTELKIQLCEKIFTNQALWYTIEKNDEDLRCKREMISLVTSRVISSNEPREDAFPLSLASCPTVTEKPFPVGLYLSSSPDPDSVLAYDQSYDYRKINPLTTVGQGVFDGIVDSSILMGTLSV